MSNSSRKITLIGAGSAVFAKNMLGDILSFPELANSKICLFDLDESRLKTSEAVARRIAQALAAPASIEATTDRTRALEGASYAINMIQVGGYRPCTVTDFEIPKNLPEGCCVEVPCAVDKNGVQPIHIGRIPSQLAALMQTNINVQSLTVEAILKEDPQLIYQAAMLDPHTSAELDLDQIWALVDDLIAAHGEWIPKPLRGLDPERLTKIIH